MKLTPQEAAKVLKVGDWIKTNINSNICSNTVEGYVGEMDARGAYIWQNTHHGDRGKISPSTMGFEYSWFIGLATHNSAHDATYNNAYVEIINKVDNSIEEKVINNKENLMSSLLKKFKSLTITDPQKTYMRIGLVDEDNLLTDDGHKLFTQFLFDNMIKELADHFDKDVVAVLSKALDEESK